MSRHEDSIEHTASKLLQPDEKIVSAVNITVGANQALRDGSITPDRHREVCAVLDRDWAYRGELFMAYGAIVIAGEGVGEETEELIGQVQEGGQIVISFGLAIDEIDGVQEIGFMLGVVDVETNSIAKFGWADVSKISLEPLVADEAKAKHYMEYHYPDVSKDILERCIASKDDLDFILSLKDFCIDHNAHHTIGECDPGEVREMMTKYINHEMPLQTTVPYSVAFRGVYFPESSRSSEHFETGEYSYQWKKYLAIPQNITMIPEIIDKDSDDFWLNNEKSIPAVTVLLLPLDESDATDGAMVTLPVADNLKLISNADKVERFKDLDDDSH